MFIFPQIWDTIAAKLTEHISRRPHLTLQYYSGRFLAPPTQMCFKTKCSHQYHIPKKTEGFNWKVHYPPSLKATYVETSAVEYPAGQDADRCILLPIEITDTFHHRVHSWMTSTLYHIDCSSPADMVAHWSALNRTLINHICLDEPVKTLSRQNTTVFLLQPPYPEFPNSRIWKLTMSFKGQDLQGHLIFLSHPMEQHCENDFRDFSHLTKIQPCATLKSTVNVSLSKEEFSVGFQKFAGSSLTFYPQQGENVSKTIVSMTHMWTPHTDTNNHSQTAISDFRKRFELVHLSSARQWYSWRTAAIQCRKNGMMLPQLENEKFTRMFVSFISREYHMMYALFVGLVSKVFSSVCFVFEINTQIKCLSFAFQCETNP